MRGAGLRCISLSPHARGITHASARLADRPAVVSPQHPLDHARPARVPASLLMASSRVSRGRQSKARRRPGERTHPRDLSDRAGCRAGRGGEGEGGGRAARAARNTDPRGVAFAGERAVSYPVGAGAAVAFAGEWAVGYPVGAGAAVAFAGEWAVRWWGSRARASARGRRRCGRGAGPRRCAGRSGRRRGSRWDTSARRPSSARTPGRPSACPCWRSS